MPSRILSRVVGLGLLLTALIAGPAAAAPFVDGEFEIPGGLDTNNKIAAGPDGNMWMTITDATNDVARITPSGEVTEYDIDAGGASGITAGPDGNMWATYTEAVVKFSPANPSGTDKSTTIAQITGSTSIVTGPDGNLWVATAGDLVMIPPGDPAEAKAFPVGGLAPRDIDVAGSLLVVADFGEGRIITFDVAGGEPTDQKDYPVGGGPQGVAGSPSGQIAFSNPGASPEAVGLITPPNPAQQTELLGDPFGVALGADGAFWIPRTADHVLTRLTADNQMTTLTGLDQELGPRQIAAGPGNTLWVTMEDFKNLVIPEKVARVSGLEPPSAGTPPPPPPPVTPNTRITKGPKKKVRTKFKRAKVRFRFASTPPGATFECALTKLKKKKRARKARFRPCRSPQTYRAPVGRYRFQVRAVLAGVTDPTPAKRVFRVIRKR